MNPKMYLQHSWTAEWIVVWSLWQPKCSWGVENCAVNRLLRAGQGFLDGSTPWWDHLLSHYCASPLSQSSFSFVEHFSWGALSAYRHVMHSRTISVQGTTFKNKNPGSVSAWWPLSMPEISRVVISDIPISCSFVTSSGGGGPHWREVGPPAHARVTGSWQWWLGFNQGVAEVSRNPLKYSLLKTHCGPFLAHK